MIGLGSALTNPITGGLGSLDPITAGVGALTKVLFSGLASLVTSAATAALHEAATLISRVTAPQLQSTWFSATYWRVAGFGSLLTLPLLFAAAVQSIVRSDVSLLLRAAFAYLPLALIGVVLAAPIATLLLAATDQMSGLMARAAAGGGSHFLIQTGVEMGGLSRLAGSSFLAIAVGGFILAAAIGLTIELLVRAAAVYVVLLMLPLAFAALVWPARRIWAIRLIELLIALILAKFVIVAVLSLAAAAYGSSGGASVTRLLTALALMMLSTLAPWALLRILPFTEVAAGAAGALRNELPRFDPARARGHLDSLAARVEELPERLRRADRAPGAEDDDGPAGVLARNRVASDGRGQGGPAEAVGARGRDGGADPVAVGGVPGAAVGGMPGAAVGGVPPGGRADAAAPRDAIATDVGVSPMEEPDFEEVVLGPAAWVAPGDCRLFGGERGEVPWEKDRSE